MTGPDLIRLAEERRWIAFYRMEGPTMEHLFVGDTPVSLCGRLNRTDRREWSKPQPRCAHCERRGQP